MSAGASSVAASRTHLASAPRTPAAPEPVSSSSMPYRSARAPPSHDGNAAARYSHSIVPGGLDVMSSTTRLTSRSSLIMREAICSSRS